MSENYENVYKMDGFKPIYAVCFKANFSTAYAWCTSGNRYIGKKNLKGGTKNEYSGLLISYPDLSRRFGNVEM